MGASSGVRGDGSSLRARSTVGRARAALWPLAVLAAGVGAAGCAATAPLEVNSTPAPRTAAHVFITRPLQLSPRPTPFISGVVTAFTEELVLAGYDFRGTTWDIDDEEALLDELAALNRVVPGTCGIHLTFSWEAPLVGFGTIHGPVRCVVHDPTGRVILRGAFDPPQPQTVAELVLPPKHPDVAGRQWGKHTWDLNLSFLFPRRTQP